MKSINRVTRYILCIILLIISAHCPLFDAKPSSFLQILIQNKSISILLLLSFSIGIISIFLSYLSLVNRKRISLLFSIIALISLLTTCFYDNTKVVGPGLFLLLALSLLLILLSHNIFIESFTFSIKDIAEIGVLLSIAVLFDQFIKIKIGANGGSISIAMLPLMIIVLRKGCVKGFISVGIIYGLINCLLDGYGIIYYPLDYLLSFGSLAALGLVRNIIFNKKRRLNFISIVLLILGVLFSVGLRLFFSTISGVYNWGYTSYLASFIYNLVYLLPSTLVVLVLLLSILKPLLLLEKIFPSK